MAMMKTVEERNQEELKKQVTEDFLSSLEDLIFNDRAAINNVTVMAKDTVEHADAVSKAIIQHVLRVRPGQKLPALYVLDSIAKNIGTPYTLFLGNQLYNVFMDAYSTADRPLRKKLDEMLNTWKNPVPGSIDTRPVFPVDITRRIDNALLRLKTVAIEAERQQQRQHQELFRRKTTGAAQAQWRNTPTPPQQTQQFFPPTTPGYPQQPPYQPNGHYQGPPALPPQNMPNVYQHTASSYQPPQPHPSQSFTPQPVTSEDLSALHQDVDELVKAMQRDWAQNYQDASLGHRLKALLDLQSILRSQTLPPDQIQAVRRQVTGMQNERRAAQPTIAPPPVPTPRQYGYGYQGTTPQPQLGFAPPPLPPQSTPVSAPGVPSGNALADLFASVERSKQTPVSSSDVYSPKLSSVQPALPQPPVPPRGAVEENPLLARLRASGLLGQSATPATPPTSVAPPDSSAQAPPSAAVPSQTMTNLSELLRKVTTAKPAKEVELTSASLKIPRPHLISRLYEARPSQCLTCGKRFLADDARTKKARHMDWHFRTNNRIQEYAQKGQSRSWYVDEMEWIGSRSNADEYDASAPDASRPGSSADGAPGASSGNASKGGGGGASAAADPRQKFVPAPSDSSGAEQRCPICQERFEPTWRDDLQDFVWMDAVRIGGRVYHASCFADLRRSVTPLGGAASGRVAGGAILGALGAGGRRGSTPDSVLGKRKIEDGSDNPTPLKAVRESAD